MALGVEGMPAGRVVIKTALLAFGTFLMAASLTAVSLAMRSVMDIGGTCASGGPYEIAQECPDGIWLMPVGIFTGVFSVGLLLAGQFRAGGPKPVLLAWPALFISLGWNFWEYGLDPPDGSGRVVWGWIVCGVVFVLMGGVPLLLLLAKPQYLLWGSSGPARTRSAPASLLRPLPVPSGLRFEPVGAAPAAPRDGGPFTPEAPAGASDDVVSQLERLADLHRQGALDDDEYEAAKAAVLDWRRRS